MPDDLRDPSRAPIRVLLVEDSDSDAFLVQRHLQQTVGAVFVPTRVESLVEAKAALDAGDFDLILLDLTLPDSQNLETVRGIREVAPTTPTVVLTGREDNDLAMEATRFGTQDYLVKGQYNVASLGRKLCYAVERHQMSQELENKAAALAESEAYLKVVFASLPVAIVLIDAVTHQVKDVNPAATQLYGAAREAMIGQGCRDLLCPEHEGTCPIIDHQQSLVNAERTMRRADGTPLAVQVTVVPVTVGGRSLLMEILVDLTEHHAMAAAKEKLEAQMRQQQKLESIGTLASGVAHEINNPINGIMNYADLIREALPAGSREAEYCSEIIHETNRVATIVRNLLAFSRDEKQTHSPARMGDIVNATLSLIQTVIKRDQVELRVDLAEGLPEIKCRSQQIQQVLMNLLTNARDALNERYPGYDPDKVIALTVRQVEHDGRAWLRTTVEDHGSGVPPALRERIFDPFFTTKDRTKGTGLGLAISHGIVGDHHGALTVESEPNQYTKFHLDLPVDNGWDLET